MTKYGSQKVKIDGITFDSKLEAHRYQELKLMMRAGTIQALEVHKRFELIPAFTKNGKKYRSRSYEADFVYYDTILKKVIVEDTKGFETDLYKFKRTLFEYQYPELEIVEVKR